MTVFEAFTRSFNATNHRIDVERKRGSVVGSVVGVILGVLAAFGVRTWRTLAPLTYTLGALGLGTFAAWHTFGIGAAAGIGAGALLILEWRVRG